MAIKPASDQEEYDIDAVCEFRQLNKLSCTQEQLKIALGAEVDAYRQAHGMLKPMRERRRCWTLDYADGAQFHMDVMPAVPNAQGLRELLERHHLDTRFAATGIAITDNEAINYRAKSEHWHRSNPKGYHQWFVSRMKVIFERRRMQLKERMRVTASVETIPDYKVKTPLQQAIMILKRHRDLRFADRPDERPISIILTTLAAHAYNGAETIGQALLSILSGMDRYIEMRDGVPWVANPTDPWENFADRWRTHPERARAFREWLELARADFTYLATLHSRQSITESIAPRIGRPLAERAQKRRVAAPSSLLRSSTSAPAVISSLAFPSEPRVPTKPRGFA
ncbi:hypothetical protein SAMN04488115_102218 [Bosea lathyri]|uniref:Uncharacterized protein n=1 Tax=Bosea lathyri TaxID=1036778 RepID=A0A1H5V9G3_9HYPH|nr:nucleotidyltransferase [Bosea lathyri]SEF84022.1 hypothetical protein SAMN04488115_102218 [Bosea lathyri]